MNSINHIFSVNESQLITKVYVATPDKARTITSNALWDTGSSHTIISDRVVKTLELAPIGEVDAINTSGVSQIYAYRALMFFEEGNTEFESNFFEFQYNGQKFDIIVGMDIISRTNFSIKRNKNQVELIVEFLNPELI